MLTPARDRMLDTDEIATRIAVEGIPRFSGAVPRRGVNHHPSNVKNVGYRYVTRRFGSNTSKNGGSCMQVVRKVKENRS